MKYILLLILAILISSCNSQDKISKSNINDDSKEESKASQIGQIEEEKILRKRNNNLKPIEFFKSSVVLLMAYLKKLGDQNKYCIRYNGIFKNPI
jgi:hypothetical protein